MKKPMKKYINGVLNKSYISSNKTSRSDFFLNNTDLFSDDIKKRSEEKKIHDSRLEKQEEKDAKKLREETNEKVDKAKELLGIKETSNKKHDKLDNDSLDYRKRHEIRDFSEKSNDMGKKEINYDDIFEDL